MENKIEILCKEKEQELLNKYFPKSSGRPDSETAGEYTKDLLLVMRTDFLEEITGNDINCKAFDEA